MASRPAIASLRHRLPRRPLNLLGPLRTLSAVLIVAGALLLADAALTVAWQEPLSGLYALARQSSLAGDLRSLDRAAPSQLELRALDRLRNSELRVAFLARALKRGAREGSAVGRVHIPHIGANFVLVAGTSESALRNGPGIYPQTPFPGAHGTVAIAGHRTTYLAPFRHIDALRKGDSIVIEMPYARFVYRVQRHRIVAPTDVGVIDPVGYDRLVLSACHPLYSAAQRYIVFARLVTSIPRGAAVQAPSVAP